MGRKPKTSDIDINIKINNDKDITVTHIQKQEDARVRITVPANDTSVLLWMERQANTSYSIRELIHKEISKNGYIDTFCKPVGSLNEPNIS